MKVFILSLRLCHKFIDGPLRYDFQPAMPGPATSSSVCYVNEEKIYIYDPSSENANFGSLNLFSIDRNCHTVNKNLDCFFIGHKWIGYHANTDNMSMFSLVCRLNN